MLRQTKGAIVDALSRLGNTRMLPAMQFSPTRQVTAALAFCYPLIAHLAVAHGSSSKLTLALYLPPVLVPALLAWIFGRTLRPGRTPLIEQVILILHAQNSAPEDAALVYARRLTLAWTLLFVGLAATNLLLALFAEPQQWSLFANLIAYLIVVAFFAVEHAYRRRRFPHQPYRNVLEFVQRLLASLP